MAKRKPKKQIKPIAPMIPVALVDPIADALNKATSDVDAAAPSITCAADLIPFVKIPSAVPGQGLIPFERYAFQLDVLAFWSDNKSTCMLKDRQMGISWLCALDCLYDLGWKPYQNICSVNYEKEQAQELIWRMQILYSTLPKAWRPEITFNLQEARSANGSRAYCVATKDTAAAGDTIHKLVIDEAGLIKNLDKIWPSLMPAVQHGKCMIFSTPRQAKRYFKVIVDEAKKGTNGFAFKRLPYAVHPDREPGTAKGDAWKAAELKRFNGDQRKFDREYGGQFEQEGDCYFGASVTDALRATIAVKCLVPILQWGDRLKLFKRRNAQHRYVIGADVAEGLADGDFSSASVLDCETGEEVATYNAHVNTTDYAETLHRLALMYGDAWLAIEANNQGGAVTSWLFKHIKYRKLFREKVESRIGGPTSRLGLTTSSATKPIMLAGLENGLRAKTIQAYDLETVEELESFVCLSDGSYGANTGSHDDRVIALALAAAARTRKVPSSW